MKFAAGIVALAAVALNVNAAPLSSEPYQTTIDEHYLRTFTNGDGYSLLVDEANTELGGLIVGQSGVDGIYNANEGESGSGTDTWVDVHDGVYAVIDNGNPNHYTVYDSQSSPIATVSQSPGKPTNEPSKASHYMMTFVNEADSATLLIDQAVTDAAILEVGHSGIDGIYTIPPGGIPTPTATATGTDTWVDSANGYVAVIDNGNPNVFTVYDIASNPIHTVSY
ncbi:hypothetical protein H4R20_001663 [Coemansia guatemalensis]|uniref:Uncharacterized protein n=1 Tax=Coemansia guatemalensis TaxID=2761395 RepID=A0A9W8HYS2_9FUNG|nr:hypothetical protein H4R20_001663 [Coemansia guatemalensis]